MSNKPQFAVAHIVTWVHTIEWLQEEKWFMIKEWVFPSDVVIDSSGNYFKLTQVAGKKEYLHIGIVENEFVLRVQKLLNPSKWSSHWKIVN